MAKETLEEFWRDPDGEVGRPYRGWREGDFDAHLIDVGIAEAFFHVYPDGTTALFDCGDRDPDSRGASGRAPRPNGTRRPGEWVARYIARLCPALETIDYLVATHFHKDHIGATGIGAEVTEGRGDDYELSGFAQVGEFFRFGVALDRGYPEYRFGGEKSAAEVENFRRFLSFHEKERGLKREAFRVGARDQIALRRAPERYAFHTRNVCANGIFWTGVGEETEDFLAKSGLDDIRSRLENTMSLGVAFEYGPFRFFTGGDLMNVTRRRDWSDGVDAEGAIGRVIGSQDACKANHHASRGSSTRGFVNAVRSRVYMTNVWQDRHLKLHALEAMGDDGPTGYPGARFICPTGLLEWKAALADRASWGRYLVKRSGHVVLKAYDGGARFKVYYVSSVDESMRVDAVLGPFTARLARS